MVDSILCDDGHSSDSGGGEVGKCGNDGGDSGGFDSGGGEVGDDPPLKYRQTGKEQEFCRRSLFESMLGCDGHSGDSSGRKVGSGENDGGKYGGDSGGGANGGDPPLKCRKTGKEQKPRWLLVDSMLPFHYGPE